MWNNVFIFSKETTVFKKKLSIEKNSFFAVDYVKIIELHVVHTWRYMLTE